MGQIEITKIKKYTSWKHSFWKNFHMYWKTVFTLGFDLIWNSQILQNCFGKAFITGHMIHLPIGIGTQHIGKAAGHKWHSLHPTFWKYCKSEMKSRCDHLIGHWLLQKPMLSAFSFYSAAIMQFSNQICKKVKLFSVQSFWNVRLVPDGITLEGKDAQSHVVITHTHLLSVTF